jgi:hypothetical protein
MTDVDPDAVTDQLQQFLDRQAITDLVSRYGLMVDSLRFRDATDLFTDGFVFEFPTVRYALKGGRRVDVVPAEMTSQLGMPPYEATQHVISNVLIELDGDTATVRANLIATHVHRVAEPSSHFDLGGVYEFTVRRTDAGWRLSGVKLTQVWVAGDGPAPTTLKLD